MNACLQGRGQDEHPWVAAPAVDAVQLVRLLLTAAAQLVLAQVERRRGRVRRGLDLDQPLTAIAVEGADVEAGAVVVLDRLIAVLPNGRCLGHELGHLLSSGRESGP